MRSLVDKQYVALFETLQERDVIVKNHFKFNIIANASVYRTIRLTLVDALAFYNNGSSYINYGVHVIKHFKFEELDVNDNSVITNTNYVSVQNVFDNLQTWIENTPLHQLVGSTCVEYKLTKQESANALKLMLHHISDFSEVMYESYTRVNYTIIRNEL